MRKGDGTRADPLILFAWRVGKDISLSVLESERDGATPETTTRWRCQALRVDVGWQDAGGMASQLAWREPSSGDSAGCEWWCFALKPPTSRQKSSSSLQAVGRIDLLLAACCLTRHQAGDANIDMVAGWSSHVRSARSLTADYALVRQCLGRDAMEDSYGDADRG
jgi:hypothetical protein